MNDLIVMLQGIASSRDMLIAVIGALGGGGLFLGVAALMKVRPERGKIIIEAAGEVVVMQKGLIDNLEKRNDELETKCAELESECASLRQRCRKLEIRMVEIEGKYPQ